MGRATSKGNETKGKMKHPEKHIARPELNPVAIDLWLTALPVRPWVRPAEQLNVYISFRWTAKLFVRRLSFDDILYKVNIFPHYIDNLLRI